MHSVFPRAERKVKLTVYVTPTVAAAVRKKADRENTSVSEVINDKLIFATGSYVV